MMLCLIRTADAQFTSTLQSRLDGFYTMVVAEGVIWTIPDLDLDSETGMGLGARFGYYFVNNFGISMGIDISRITPRSNVTYDFAHIDFGLSRVFGNDSNRLRPYIRPAFVLLFGSSVESTEDIFSNPELNNLRGSGIGAGLGSFYFINPRISLQLSYHYSVIWINTLRLVLLDVQNPEDNIQTHRLMLGVSLHF